MPELNLRPTAAADYAFLADLHKQTFAGYAAQTWGWDEVRLMAEFRQEFADSVRQVVCLGRHKIGSLVVEDDGDSLFLDYLAILPTYQSRGVGTKLIQLLLDEAASRAIPVRLHVLKCNPAKALYERLGFCVVGSDQHRYLLEAWPSSRRGARRNKGQSESSNPSTLSN